MADETVPKGTTFEMMRQEREAMKKKPFLKRAGQGVSDVYNAVGNTLFGSPNPPRLSPAEISPEIQKDLTASQKAILSSSGVKLSPSSELANPDVPQFLDRSGILPAVGRYLFRTGSNLGDINSVSISPQGGATVQTNKPMRGESGALGLREAALKEVFGAKQGKGENFLPMFAPITHEDIQAYVPESLDSYKEERALAHLNQWKKNYEADPANEGIPLTQSEINNQLVKERSYVESDYKTNPIARNEMNSTALTRATLQASQSRQQSFIREPSGKMVEGK